LLVTDEDECPAGYENVLYYDWGGMEEGCYNDGTFYGPKETECDQRLGLSFPIRVTSLNGQQLCGKRLK